MSTFDVVLISSSCGIYANILGLPGNTARTIADFVGPITVSNNGPLIHAYPINRNEQSGDMVLQIAWHVRIPLGEHRIIERRQWSATFRSHIGNEYFGP